MGLTRVLLVLRMGARNVLRYRRRSLISGFAIVVSILASNCMRGMVNGTEGMVLEQIVRGQMGAVQVHKKGFVANVTGAPLSFAFPIDDALMQKIRTTPGVIDATPRILGAGMVSIDDRSVPAPIIAIDPAHEYVVCPLKAKDVTEGKALGNGGAVLTPQLKRQLGAKLGSEVTLLSQDSEGVMNAGLAKAEGFLSDIPLLTSNKKLMFVSLEVAQQLLRIEGKALEIAIAVDDPWKPDSVAALISERLGPDYEVHTWRDRAPTIVDSMAERRVIFNYATGIFVFIALLGVTLAMLMSVLGRTREIGTMMAVGMRRRQIIGLFVAEAVVLGVIGGIAGVLLGQVLVRIVHAVGLPITPPGAVVPVMLRPSVEWSFGLQIGLLIAVGCIVASIYPAFAAARLKPVQAMGAL